MLPRVPIKESDQTARVLSLFCVFNGCICQLVPFARDRLIWFLLAIFNPLPNVLYLEHCIISINNSNFQICSSFFLHFNSFENIIENGTFASQGQIFYFS